MIGRRMCLIGVVALLAACERGPVNAVHADDGERVVPQPVPSAREPAPDTTGEPPVLRSVSVLDDAFMARIERLQASIEAEPTTIDNFAKRLPEIQAYYDALQGHGVLLNYYTNMAINSLATLVAAGAPIPPAFQARITGLDQLFFELRQIQQSLGRTGSLVRVSPASNVLEAKSFNTVVFDYTVGAQPIEAGGRIRIGHNWYGDLGEIQFSRPLDPGYATVTVDRSAVTLTPGPEYWLGQQFSSLFGAYTPSLTVTSGRLEPGDTMRITLGDTSGGSPGWLAQSFSLDAMDLRFEVDFEGDGLWVPVAQPRFRVTGTDAHHLRVVAPSVARPGESIELRVNVEDRYFNEAVRGPGELVAYLDDREVSRARSVADVPGRFVFPAIEAPPSDAPLYFTVRDTEGRLEGRSNPVVIRASGPKLYWGETHGHEGYTDGNGTPDWYLGYARDVAFLDFASLTGHDLMLSELHFRDVLRATREFNDPARGFVTFPAYEWTASWNIGGHHNVLYMDDTQKVLPTAQTGTITNLFAAQRRHNDPDKVLIIPHAHQPGDWTKLQDDLGPLVEIYSTHGSFEWFGRKFLQEGHLVGFNAASDDHIGHPGNAPARAWSRGGLAAVFAPDLGRQEIFAGLKARRTYGTSLARIFLETDVAGGKMGEVVAWVPGEAVDLQAMVAGTAPIANMTLVVNGEDVLTRDFANADRNTGRLWFRMSSSSEPNVPATPRTPAAGHRYWGTVEIAGSAPVTLEAVEPLGVEPYGDDVRQVSAHGAAFSWRIRGDYDAALLTLAQEGRAETVTVRVWRSPIDATNNWNIQHPPRLPGEFERDAVPVPLGELLVEEQVPISRLLGGPIEGEIEAGSSWVLSFVEPEIAAWQKLAVKLDETHGLRADQRNHVYVRVQQLDDHMAWGSPVFLEPSGRR